MAKKDVDWLNKDVVYRSEADSNYANVFDQLSNIMSQQNVGYMGIDKQRKQDAINQQLAGQQQAANAAARGLGTSGLNRRGSNQVLTAGEQQRQATTAQEEELSRQYGARNAIQQKMGQDFSLQTAIENKNYTELAKLFGLLGSQGVTAGTGFSNAMSQSAGAAANRAGVKAFDYLKGWQ